jgi:hypothetical protein
MAIRRRNTRRSKKRTRYKRLHEVVCAGCGKEVKVEGHRLLAKSFSVSIAIKNNEVINQI